MKQQAIRNIDMDAAPVGRGRAMSAPRWAACLLLAHTVTSAAATLERLEVSTMPTLTVRAELSEPVVPRYGALPSTGPPQRIFIDLPETTIGDGVPRALAGSGVLRNVRTGSPDGRTTRVVLDLDRAVPFAVEHGDRTITITLGSDASVAVHRRDTLLKLPARPKKNFYLDYEGRWRLDFRPPTD